MYNFPVNQPTHEDLIMTNPEFTPIPRKRLLDKILTLENYFDLDMSFDIIKDNTLPTYFSVNQLNENTVMYEFEIDEGSAEIIVYNFGSGDFESYEYNEVLEKHIDNKKKWM